MNYYVYRRGKQIGPLCLSEVTDRLANGDFAQSDHIWHDGLNCSKPISDLFQSHNEETPPLVRAQSPSDRPNETTFESFTPPQGKEFDIPPNDLKTIRAYAQREHPDDYSTQRHVIEEQCESFAAIQSLRPGDVPAVILNKIREKAAGDHPEDYSTQKYVIEEQRESFVAIKNLRAPDVPPAIFSKIRERADADHPDDYSTQKYVIEEELDAYRDLHSS